MPISSRPPSASHFRVDSFARAIHLADVQEIIRSCQERTERWDDAEVDSIRVELDVDDELRRDQENESVLAIPIGLAGGFSMSYEKPVGSTMIRLASSSTATEIGVLFPIPPSARYRPPMWTEGNTPGIAALASTASTGAWISS